MVTDLSEWRGKLESNPREFMLDMISRSSNIPTPLKALAVLQINTLKPAAMVRITDLLNQGIGYLENNDLEGLARFGESLGIPASIIQLICTAIQNEHSS